VSSPSKRGIASKYGVSDAALTRHKVGHISKSLRAVHERRKERGDIALYDRVDGWVARLEAVVERAEQRGGKEFLAGAKELRGWLRFYGEVTGELDTRPQVQVLNVTQSADWQMLSNIIEQALAPYPEARLAVVERIQAALEAHQTDEEAG
jgi:hypothetical protein